MRSNAPLHARKKLPAGRASFEMVRGYDDARGRVTRGRETSGHHESGGYQEEGNKTNSRDGTARDQIQTTHTYVTSRLTSS